MAPLVGPKPVVRILERMFAIARHVREPKRVSTQQIVHGFGDSLQVALLSGEIRG